MTHTESLSRQAFTEAALELIDTNGVEALTLKNLGLHLGVTHTAVYRYFDGIPHVVAAVRAYLLSEMDTAPLHESEPRERIIEFAFRFREQFKKHPNLAPIFVTDSGVDEAVIPPSLVVIEELEKLGFSGPLLTHAYQTLESYVVGGTLWDFATAPHHLPSRQQRLRMVKHKDFDKVSRDRKLLAQHNEDSFRLGLESLIDGLVNRLRR